MTDDSLNDSPADAPLPRRVRLDALDPSRDRLRLDAQVISIAADAMVERRRLQRSGSAARAPRGVLAGVLTWSRPALAAAAAIVVLAGAALMLVPTPSAAAAAPASLAESAGVAAPLVMWATGERTPSTAELMDAFGRQGPADGERTGGTIHE